MIENSSFPYEEWALTENEYRPDEIGRNASLFFLGNGYLGIKGSLEDTGVGNGCFINGFYESGPQFYGESAFGFPDRRQAILNLPDPVAITVFLDDERFSPDYGVLINYKRQLDLKKGIVKRELVWKSPGGRKMKLSTTRCVSFDRRHLAVLSLRVSDLEGVSRLRIVSGCSTEVISHQADKSDPRTGAGFRHSVLDCLEKRIERDRAVIIQQTLNSRLLFSEAVSNSHCSGLNPLKPVSTDSGIEFHYEGFPDAETVSFSLDKFISFYTSIESDPKQLADLAEGEVSRAEHDGIDVILSEQAKVVTRFWDAADVRIDSVGEDGLRQGLRFNLFSIYQSAGRDGLRNIAAKGLSGEGYEGHYFWDTEIFVIPFFAYTFPGIAGKLLEYRYNILDEARKRARVMSEKGALFPWRTINGEEASAYFPAGTAQYHINADIAYGIGKYESISGDHEFLERFGCEILVETARLWMSLGFFDKKTASFRINCVTGPDEYTAIVNNNYFTNIMARNNLRYAAETISSLKKNHPEKYSELAGRLNFDEYELVEWKKAASMMYLPYDEKLCVHAQDDSFLQKEPWDFDDDAKNKHPLLLYLHPLVIYRYQILKQPDVVLANFLQSGSFSRIQKIRDYDYYNPLTTGDSSLSPCVQSIMAAELGRVEEAYGYFMKTARMDIDDINSNVCDGVHIAAMGGTWLSLIYGFAGLRDNDGNLSFSPRLPKAWNGLKFNLGYRGKKLSVDINHEKAVYSLSENSSFAGTADCSLKISHMGSDYTVRCGRPVEISMKPELKAVIFDLDGVITDTSEMHYQAWKRLSEERGYNFSRQINEALRGIGRLESLDIILRNSGVSLTVEERYHQGELKNSYYKELLKTITPDNILPGIAVFLDELKENKVKTALASASRNAGEVISRLGLESSFNVIMNAAAVERGKPDPEIFVTAAEQLGVPEEYCAGIEDAAAGIEAIKAAGIFSVGIGDAASGADWAVSCTSELNLDELTGIFMKGKK